MKKIKEIDFSKARTVTPQETEMFRKAIEDTFLIKRPRRGRPPKGVNKYRPICIRVHPKAVRWARIEAKRCGVGYQTIINRVLLKASA
ncbi:MAG: AT hook motif protein [Elusimicrobia bacterium]|nr:AT hook motif protein [Elusimicrobiota bacterium]